MGHQPGLGGTECGSVHIYCFLFEPYRGTCGLSHKITVPRKLGLKFKHY